MEIREILDVLMFAVSCLFLMAGFPVAFTLGGSALLFALLGYAFGIFDFSFVGFLIQRIFGVMSNDVLLAVPLFVYMGVMLERSLVAEDLLESMGKLFGSLRGGLGISVTVVGALLAASTGIVGATVVTMGLLSLPTMLKRGYDPALTAGTICAAGTLGQIIPPSIVLVLLGDVISSAYQAAQLAHGVYAPETVSVGDLFAGALLPGLMLVGLYILYQIGMAIFRPESSPALPPEDIKFENGASKYQMILRSLLPPAILIIAVLGSILSGIATPTEAAALGAVGSTFLAGWRADRDNPKPIYIAAGGLLLILLLTRLTDLRFGRDAPSVTDMLASAAALAASAAIVWGLGVCLLRCYRNGTLQNVSRSTMEISSMVFVILIGAALFSLVFRGLGGDEAVSGILSGMPGGALGAMVLVMGVMFALGFFLDFIEIIFIVVPLVAPVLLGMGLNPVWLGVMIAVNLQTSFLTPPFGFALFYLRGVAPPEMTTLHIYKGIIPFVLIQLLALVLLALFPPIVTWLPSFLN
ncbi:MAG: TRAP transporter large permease subunit [Alphaproteobacteria bacterium]|nr:TRAP transporter large permease subunit [Alphaproteobacteria bacterium]